MICYILLLLLLLLMMNDIEVQEENFDYMYVEEEHLFLLQVEQYLF